MGGNKSPTAKDIENILGSVGLDVDMEDAHKVVSVLSGKSVDEIIKAGLAKISSVPSGCATTPAVVPVASDNIAAVSSTESKKEESKEEPKEESDEDMGFGLFD